MQVSMTTEFGLFLSKEQKLSENPAYQQGFLIFLLFSLFRKRWGGGKFSLKIFRRPLRRFPLFQQVVIKKVIKNVWMPMKQANFVHV